LLVNSFSEDSFLCSSLRPFQTLRLECATSDRLHDDRIEHENSNDDEGEGDACFHFIFRNYLLKPGSELPPDNYSRRCIDHDIHYLRLCGSPGHRSLKMVLGISLPRENPGKFLFMEPNPLISNMIA
jgi:hypothetical protein